MGGAVFVLDAVAAAFLAQMLAQQLAGAGIKEPHAMLVPLRFDAMADPAGRGSVVGGLDLDAAVEMDGTLTELVVAEGLDRQLAQGRPFLSKNGGDLALGGAVDAGIGPALIPATEVGVGVGKALEALAFERCVLGVADAALDLALAIRIPDRHGRATAP